MEYFWETVWLIGMLVLILGLPFAGVAWFICSLAKYKKTSNDNAIEKKRRKFWLKLSAVVASFLVLVLILIVLFFASLAIMGM